MKRAFKTRYFVRLMRKTELTDEVLCAAVVEMSQGLVDANLGGGLVKKRVPLSGRGKRGSTRTLLAINCADRWFFIYGFAKNERENISQQEEIALKTLAKDLLIATENILQKSLELEELEEICHGKI